MKFYLKTRTEKSKLSPHREHTLLRPTCAQHSRALKDHHRVTTITQFGLGPHTVFSDSCFRSIFLWLILSKKICSRAYPGRQACFLRSGTRVRQFNLPWQGGSWQARLDTGLSPLQWSPALQRTCLTSVPSPQVTEHWETQAGVSPVYPTGTERIMCTRHPDLQWSTWLLCDQSGYISFTAWTLAAASGKLGVMLHA